MVKQVRHIITESERNNIRSMYGLSPMSDVVIVDWLSPDEKYCIFLDELYDINNKKKIGNIWENFDNFKFFLKHSFEVAENISQQIKEDVLQSIDKLILTEGTQDFTGLKPYVKQFINENWAEDAWNKTKQFAGDVYDYGKESVKGAVQGVKDFAKTSWEGLKKTYSYISDGQWKEVFSIIGKGVLYLARKIRSALYHPIGLILDAILVASGIGKGFQFVVWAVVVALDIYELTTGNYEEQMSLNWKLLFFGVDLIGLVFAGAAAKPVRQTVVSLMNRFGKTAEGLSKAINQNSVLRGIAEKILKASEGASSAMQRAMSHLQKNSPKIYKFFSGVIGGLGKFLTMLVNSLKSLFKFGVKVLSTPGRLVTKVAPKSLQGTKFLAGASGAANVIVPIGAIGGYTQGKKREYEDDLANASTNSNVESEYNYDQL